MRKFLTVGAIAAVAVVSLAACSSNKSAKSPASSSSAPSTSITTSSAQPAPIPTPTSTPTLPSAGDLTKMPIKDLAWRIVTSAENSSLEWRDQYGYVEDIHDGQGYTAGIIGFCSETGDMLDVVNYYTKLAPQNGLIRFLPALVRVNGTPSHAGLGNAFVDAWKQAATDKLFQLAQRHVVNTMYFGPAVAQAKADGLHTLGQFIYYDAMVMHGPGDDPKSFGGIRKKAILDALPPSRGGDEVTYLTAFIKERRTLMKSVEAHDDTSRLDTEQSVWLAHGNLKLALPLLWHTYGDPWRISTYRKVKPF